MRLISCVVVLVVACSHPTNGCAQMPNPWTANLTPVVPVVSGVDQPEVLVSGEGEVPFGPMATIQVKMHADGVNPLAQTVRARLVVELSQGPPAFLVHTYQTADLIVAPNAPFDFGTRITVPPYDVTHAPPLSYSAVIRLSIEKANENDEDIPAYSKSFIVNFRRQ